MKKPALKKYIKWVGRLLMLVSILYIGNVLLTLEVDWSILLSFQNMLLVLCLGLLVMLQPVLSSVSWRILLTFLEQRKLPAKPIVKVYCKSNLGKYLPGNIMHFAGRNLLGSQLQITQMNMVLATIIEIVSMAAAALLLVVVLSWEYLLQVYQIIVQNAAYRNILLCLLGAGCAVLLAAFFFLKKKPELVNKYRFVFSLQFLAALAKAMGIYIANFLLNGICYSSLFLFLFHTDFHWNTFISTVAISIVSWLVGYIIPGAPGGIGIREMVSIVVLQALYPESMVAVVSVVWRLITILGDIFGFLLASLLKDGYNT